MATGQVRAHAYDTPVRASPPSSPLSTNPPGSIHQEASTGPTATWQTDLCTRPKAAPFQWHGTADFGCHYRRVPPIAHSNARAAEFTSDQNLLTSNAAELAESAVTGLSPSHQAVLQGQVGDNCRFKHLFRRQKCYSWWKVERIQVTGQKRRFIAPRSLNQQGLERLRDDEKEGSVEEYVSTMMYCDDDEKGFSYSHGNPDPDHACRKQKRASVPESIQQLRQRIAAAEIAPRTSLIVPEESLGNELDSLHLLRSALAVLEREQQQELDRRPKHLLNLPLEIKRNIFSHLLTDLHVTLQLCTLNTLTPTHPRPMTALNGKEWYDILSIAAVSKGVKALLGEAIRFAGAKTDIHIIIDISKLTISRLSRSVDPRAIPSRIFSLFSSIKMIMPVEVHTTAFPTATRDSALKTLSVTLQKPKGEPNYQVIDSSWATIVAEKHFGSTLRFAEAFDKVVSTFRRIDHPLENIPQGMPLHLGGLTTGFKAVTSDSLHYFVHIFGGWAVEESRFWNGYRVRPTVPALQIYRAALARIEAVQGCEFKLGWHGCPLKADPNSSRDGNSFQAKWKLCGELIRNRRWEEAKLFKLGWHGSRIAADANRKKHEALVEARRKQAEAIMVATTKDNAREEAQMGVMTDWLDNLDVFQHDLYNADQLRWRFKPVRDWLTKVSGASEQLMPDRDIRAKTLRECLMMIGRFIDKRVKKEGNEALEEQMWDYLSQFHWPQPHLASTSLVSGKTLQTSYRQRRLQNTARSAAIRAQRAFAAESSTTAILQQPAPTAARAKREL